MEEERTVILDLVFRSPGRLSSRGSNGITLDELERFSAPMEVREQAVKELRAMGFEIVGGPTPFGVSISGPSWLVKKVFGAGSPRVPDQLSKWIEAVRIPPEVDFYP